MKIKKMLLENKKGLIFDGANADLVRKSAIRTKGSHGPLGLDADFWRKSYVMQSLATRQMISVTL